MRPALHFTAARGWINDPHGITYHGGRYQVFYQYVPDSTVWAPNCHWGHATGQDLLSLSESPVALAPGDGDGGIWTGSLVQDAERARIFYTSTSEPNIGIGRIRVATSDDPNWNSWIKGPFVAEAPTSLDIVAFRDPFLRRDSDAWRMFVGAGTSDGTAMAVSYTSVDLNDWTYEGVALQRSTQEREQVWMGALWECPQIFDLDGRAVMVSSVWDADVLHYAGYAIGSYREGRFHADTWGRLTFGESYYAPSLFFDAHGQPCLIFWMRGIADVEAGWAGAHSVPYRLRLDGDRLVAELHPDVRGHRGEEATDRHVDGLAADIVWDSVGELAVVSGGYEVLRLRRTGQGAVACVDGAETAFPVDGELRLIVDGPVLEVSSGAGLYGTAIAPRGAGLEILAPSASVFPLG